MEEGSYVDACYVDSNEFIFIADCRFPALLVLLLIAFSLNTMQCAMISKNFVDLYLISIL